MPLCALNGSARVCREELRVYCPDNYGSGPAPQFPKGEELERECRESVPPDPPTIVSSRHHPRRDGYFRGFREEGLGGFVEFLLPGRVSDQVADSVKKPRFMS